MEDFLSMRRSEEIRSGQQSPGRGGVIIRQEFRPAEATANGILARDTE
jgi:hypothetical protein